MERLNHHQIRQYRHHHNVGNADIYSEGDHSGKSRQLRKPVGHVTEKSLSSSHARFTSKAQPNHKQGSKSLASIHSTQKGLINVRPVSNGNGSDRTPRSQLNTPRKLPSIISSLKNEVDIESHAEERSFLTTNIGLHAKETNFFMESEVIWVDSQPSSRTPRSELKKSVSSCTVDGLGFDLESIDLTNDTDRRVKNSCSTSKCSDEPDAYGKAEQVESESGSVDNERSHTARRYISVESLVLEHNFNATHMPKKIVQSKDSARMEEEIPQVKVVWTTPPQTHRSKKVKEVPPVVSEDDAEKKNILNFFTRTEEGVEKEGRFENVQPILNKFFSVTEDNGVAVRCINLKQVLDNMDEFVLQPAAIGYDVQCRVTRDRKGVDRGLYPTYYMHLERPDGRKILLLTGRKRKKSTTSNYLISTDAADLSRESNHFVGKVRSNLLGTQFTIYDNGQSHKRFGLFQPYGSHTPVREELAAVVYEPNVLGFKGPRKMKVLIPEMKNEARRREHRPDHEKDNMLELFKQGDAHEFFELKNKAPIWNDDNQSFVLNFHGRVTQASVKNFQIIHEKLDNYVVLQFGRVASDLFTMDYRYPLCALQAFAVILTSFDNKLACE